VRRTVPPSAEIEQQIDELLAAGSPTATDGQGALTELAHLGAELIIQRAVEEEFDAFLGRERYERRPDALPGKRNGWRPRRLQTAEGELAVEIPQLREAAEPFTSKLFPRETKRLLQTEPLKALVVGAFVRGLSMRDVESLCEEAGLGEISKSSAARICSELRQRYRAFRQRDLSGVGLVALFLDAIYLPVRPSGAKEGVLCAWGIDREGERVLVDLCLGMRESEEDWLALGRGLVERGLGPPLLVIADGAPGLTKAIEALWPAADRQRCTVHKLRNLLAKLPDEHKQRVRARYWAALDEAENRRDGERRLRELVGELSDQGFESAAACLADDLEALCVHLRYPRKHRRRWRSTNLLERSLGEVRRRTKVIGRFPGESSCLSLCWAVLDLVIAHSNDFTFTDIEQLRLERIRRERERPARSTRGEVVAA
jgi:transposase-like protein